MSRVCVLAEHEVDEFIKSDGTRTQPDAPIDHRAHRHVSRKMAARLTREPLAEYAGGIVWKARWVLGRTAIVLNDPVYVFEWCVRASAGFAIRQLILRGRKNEIQRTRSTQPAKRVRGAAHPAIENGERRGNLRRLPE